MVRSCCANVKNIQMGSSRSGKVRGKFEFGL
jgi:hypothetical protein